MKILYLGNRREVAPQIHAVFGRMTVIVEATPTPEHAFFNVLHGHVSAVFIDICHLQGDPAEVIANITHLDTRVEVLLLGPPEALRALPPALLHACFGTLSAHAADPLDALVVRQLTEKLSLRSRLETLKTTSIVDGLTQLYNHGFIQGQIDEEITQLAKTGETLSLVMLDLDNFKHYNDSNGHPAGDEVLRRTARILEHTVRKFDFAGRYGGEEFVLVLPCCKLLSALRVAERVRAAIAAAPFAHREKQPLGRVSASLGVATLDHKHLTRKTDLVDKADQALYKAKGDGRDRVWFYREGTFFHYSGKKEQETEAHAH